MLDLIISSLRFHPALIVPAEVRDAAAFQAVIAGQTGHTILTAFHADSALDAYRRLVSMCHSAQTGLSDELLLEMCAGAWPIMVYKKQLKDNS
jgi:pilus assembly protein CpaF